MSFSSSPFRHVEMEVSENAEEIRWECSSCGGTGHWHTMIPVNPMMVIVEFWDHVHNSHNRSKEDFANWG